MGLFASGLPVLAKWGATVRVAWAKTLAYKLNFLLLVLGPVLVFFFIRYQVWSAIYRLEGISSLQGYSFEQMLAYQVWVMIVGFVALSYNGMNLSEDIRLGRISAYLVYPFGFWSFHASSFLAFAGIQLGVAAVTLLAVWGVGWVSVAPLALLNGLGFALAVGCFWFQLTFLIGILSFWLEETWVLRVMMVTVSQFFSGALIPLEFFPDWLVKGLKYLPFPYINYVPVRLLMGESLAELGSLAQAWAVLLAWLAIVALASRWLWRRGIGNYTAAGM